LNNAKFFVEMSRSSCYTRVGACTDVVQTMQKIPAAEPQCARAFFIDDLLQARIDDTSRTDARVCRGDNVFAQTNTSNYQK
jgi:hypothetical protein